MDTRIRVGMQGAAGYTGGELIRLLLHHPYVELVFAASQSQKGKRIDEVHTDLVGETDLTFAQATYNSIDVLFLCMGHGDSVQFLNAVELPTTLKVIDLSQDFRLDNAAQYGTETFVYGLPEANAQTVSKARLVANPGCFATAIQLALLPLASENLLHEAVHISGITGSSGAGQALSPTGHFSWRANNMQVYKAFTHQHLTEVTQSLQRCGQQQVPAIRFIPYRGNFTRGILATCYTTYTGSLQDAHALYQQFYQSAPFTFITTVNPDLKQVINTNKCLLYLEKHQDQLMIVSCIDNLLKGASGQALQNMNLMFGLPQTTGLQLKAMAF